MRFLIALGLFSVLILIVRNESAANPIWSDQEMRVLASLRLPDALQPPTSVSNRFADDPEAAKLGKILFFDKRLSGNGEISCANCHQPDRYYTDGLDRSVGLKRTGRNAPTVVGASHNAWLYWDGRRDSLWSQALIPFEAPAEMGSSRLAVVRIIGEDDTYRSIYEGLFGDFPDVVFGSDLPLHAGPIGEPSVRKQWRQISAKDQSKINIAFANIGKSIAAFERTLQPSPTRFDQYVGNLLASRNDKSAGLLENSDLLASDEIEGLRLFIDSDRTQCLQCHNGPMLTNGGFHNVATGTFSGVNIDFGRVFGLRAVLTDEFNCLGLYSDAKSEECLELRFINKDSHVPLDGAFKVPGLRNLTSTAPYFHDGRFDSLRAVIDHYISVPLSDQKQPHELRRLDLSEIEISQLIAFLMALSEGSDSP